MQGCGKYQGSPGAQGPTHRTPLWSANWDFHMLGVRLKSDRSYSAQRAQLPRNSGLMPSRRGEWPVCFTHAVLASSSQQTGGGWPLATSSPGGRVICLLHVRCMYMIYPLCPCVTTCRTHATRAVLMYMSTCRRYVLPCLSAKSCGCAFGNCKSVDSYSMLQCYDE